MPSTDTHPILDMVSAHLEKTGLSQSSFGDQAVGDPNFVFDLRNGREPRRSTINRVMEYIQTGVTWDQVKDRARQGAPTSDRP